MPNNHGECPNDWRTCDCELCQYIRRHVEEMNKREICTKCGEPIECGYSPVYGDYEYCGCDTKRRT